MEKRSQRRRETAKLTRAAVLCALIVVMTVVPYTGYINYGVIEITTLHLVVIVGAVMLGMRYGTILGLVWGVTCLLRAFTNQVLYAPFLNPLVSVVPRILVGFVAGAVADGLRKAECRPNATAVITAIAATLTNTVLVLSALKLFVKEMSAMPLFGTIYTTLIGVNGVIELAAAVVLTPAILAALRPRELALGVDIGASTTKLALLRNGRCIKTCRKPDGQTLEEALAAFGTAGVKRIAITGVGASFIQGDLAGIPTVRVGEFRSLSRGASHIAHKRNCLVASIGTGTSFTRVTPLRSWHVGGTGVGGGMLKSMAKLLCETDDMNHLQQLAAKGDLANTDLRIMDVCAGTVGNLMPTNTVANFGKVGADASKEDLAAGLCNMIFQSIGLMAAFAIERHLTRTIVLVGTITDWPIAHRSLDEVAALCNVHYVVPEHAAFATAIGAALEQQ